MKLENNDNSKFCEKTTASYAGVIVSSEVWNAQAFL